MQCSELILLSLSIKDFVRSDFFCLLKRAASSSSCEIDLDGKREWLVWGRRRGLLTTQTRAILVQ